MEHEGIAHHEEHPPTTIRQYVLIGVILAVITLVELWLSYSGLPDGIMIAGLLILSGVKFVIVVALFMHLRFDSKLFSRLFMAGMALASVLLLALISLFAWDHWESRNVAAVAPPPGTSAPGEPTAEGNGEGEGAPDGELMVSGQPAAEYYATNCAACHGMAREGVVGPALTPAVLTEPDDFYFETIRDGRAGTAMPPWGGQLDEADITALVTFIKTVEP